MAKSSISTIPVYGGRLTSKKSPVITSSTKKKHDVSFLEYIGKKSWYNLASLGEGAYDYVMGAYYQIGGNDEYAKWIHQKDVVGQWNAKLDEEYNPSGITRFIGDSLGGVSEESPGLIPGVGPYYNVFKIIGYMGRATSSAVQQSGELGLKEYAYGAGIGALELFTDKLFGGIAKSGKGFITTARHGIKAGASSVARQTVVKGMLSTAASEGLEEFVQEYADTALLRLTGVNKEAEFSLSNALYSGLLGFVGGGTMGGVTHGLNTTVNARRGADVRARGNANTLIKTAQFVRDEYIGNSKNYDNITSQALRSLTASVDAYNKLTTKDGRMADVLLGEIKVELSAFEASAGVDRIKTQMMQSDISKRELLAKWASSVYGKTVTAEDIAANRGGITRRMAIESFVTEIFSASKTEKKVAAIKEAIAAERVPYVKQSGTWDGESSAIYRDPKSGRYIVVEPQSDGTYGIGYSVTAEFDENRMMLAKGLTLEDAKKVLAGLADESLELGEKGIFKRGVAQAPEAPKAPDAPDAPETVKAPEKKKAPEGDKVSTDEGKKSDVDNEKAETDKKAKPEKKQSRKKKKAAKKAEAKKAGVTRYDIVALDDGKTYVKASRTVITSDTLEGRRKQISEFFNKLLNKSKAISIETLEGDRLVITKDETAFKARDNYRETDGKRIELSEDEFLVKLHAEAHIDELAEVSRKSKRALQEDRKNHSFSKDGFEYRTVYFQDFDGKYYKITLSIGHNGTVATVYNVGQIKEDALPSAKIIAVMGSRAPWNTSSDTIISQNPEKSTSSGEKVERKSLAEAGEAAEGEIEGDSTPEMTERERRRGYTDAEADAARALIKDFDTMPRSKRLAITAFVRSFGGNNIPASFKKHAAAMMAHWRKGLWIIVDNKSTEKGFYRSFPDGSRLIVINPAKATGKGATDIAYMHELGHDIWTRADAEMRKELYALATEGTTREERIEIRDRYRAGFEARGLKINNEVIREEIFTEFMSKALGNPKFFERFDMSPTRKKGIWQMMKSTYRMAKCFFGKDKQLYMHSERMATAIARVMGTQMLEAVGGNDRSGEVSAYKYSLSQNAKAELHKALYDRTYKDEIKLRDVTPEIMLQQSGVKNLPMAMQISHIRENVFSETEAKKMGLRVDEHTHYHALGEPFFLQIIDGLDNVTEAYRGTKNADNSARRENYFLLVSTFKDKNGNEINVPVYVNEHANYNKAMIDVNKISTVFGREGFREYINRQIEKKNLVRIKIRNTQNSDPNALIAKRYEKDVSNTIIAQNSQKSTSKTKKDSESDGIVDRKSLDDNLFDKDSFFANAMENGGVISHEEAEKLRGNSKPEPEKSQTAEKEQRKALLKSGKMFAGMTDEERYRRLKKRTVQSVNVDYKKLEQYGEKSGVDIFNTMIKGKTKEKTSLLKRLGEEFALFKGYSNNDVDLKFTFSKSNLSESIHHQKNGYDDLLKMMSCFDGVIENAVGLEVHNRNDVGYKADKGLNNMYVLVSSFVDGKYVIPVRLEIKEFSDKGNVLYVAVSLGKIKKSKVAVSLGKIKTDEVVAQEVADGVAQQYAHPSVTISIPRLLSKINPVDKNLLKYIPDNFLTGNRLVAKKKAIAEQLAREKKRLEKTVDNAQKTADEKAQKEARTDSSAMMRITRIIDFFKNEVLHRKYTDGAVEGAKILSDPGIRAFAEIIAGKSAAYHSIHESSRAAARALKGVYTSENPLFSGNPVSELVGGKDSTDIFGGFQPDVAEAIEVLANGNGQLSAYEIGLLDKVVRHIAHLYKTYDTIKVNGKRIAATELAYRGYRDAMFARRTVFKGDGKGVLKRIFKSVREGYLYSVVTPEVVLRDIERHVKDGVLSRLYRQIRLGEAEAGRIRATLLWDISEWLAKHKKFHEALEKERFDFGGIKISTAQAVGLYETSKREHAKQRLFSENEGIRIATADGEVKKIKVKREMIDELYRQFDADDLKYIELLEKAMADCKKYKVDTDMEVMGFTNAIDGHYYPITTDKNYFAKDISDIRQSFGLEVRNRSSNKNTVTDSKAWLFIESSQRVLERHIFGISQYAGLYEPLQALGRVYGAHFNPTTGAKAIFVDENGNERASVNEKTSLREYFNSTIWTEKGLDKYLTKLFADIQQVSKEQATIVDKFISAIRSGYVNSIFGFNPKIILTQLAAYPSAYRTLDADCLAKALNRETFTTKSGELMDKYSRLTLSRRFEGTTASEGLISKVSDLGKKMTMGIEFTDRKTIMALYAACQHQIEKDGGGAVGSEKNLKAAGELLDNILLDTQTTSLISDRSVLMRSKSEFAKLLTMFKTESMKSFSQMYDAVASYVDHKKMANEDNSYKDMLEDDKKRIGRNAGAYLISAVWVSALSIAFTKLYNIGKEDDEEMGEAIIKEAIGAGFDMIPIVSDIAAFMIDGYDMDSIPLSVINDSLGMLRDIGTVFDGNATRAEKMSYLRNSVFTIGKLIGFPAQNVYKTLRAAVAIVDRPTVYAIDNFFDKSPSYKSDMEKAIGDGNTELSQTIMRLWVSDKITGKARTEVVDELVRLYGLTDSNGEKIFTMPRSVPSKLSAAQKAKFTKAYEGADSAVYSLIKSRIYGRLDDTTKAQAVKACYDVCYVRGQQACSLEVTASGARVSAAEKQLDSNVLYAVIGFAKSYEGENKKEAIIRFLISLGIGPAKRGGYLAALGYKI